MHSQISNEEWDIFWEAYQFMAEHIDPPGCRGPEAEAWWMKTAADAAAIFQRREGHPLTRILLAVIYDYLGEKSKMRSG